MIYDGCWGDYAEHLRADVRESYYRGALFLFSVVAWTFVGYLWGVGAAHLKHQRQNEADRAQAAEFD